MPNSKKDAPQAGEDQMTGNGNPEPGRQDDVSGEESGNEESIALDADIDSLTERLSEAEAKAAENLELALRTKADAENVRRRAERDVANANKFAVEKLAGELLAVIDSLEHGMEHKAEHEESVAMQQGMELTLKMLVSTLEKHGVEIIDPQGEVFNPERHEAMSMQESADQPANTVLAVFQKGYALNGRLIRPARVLVARAPA